MLETFNLSWPVLLASSKLAADSDSISTEAPPDSPTLTPFLLWGTSEFRSRLQRHLGSSPNKPEAPLDSDELLDI